MSRRTFCYPSLSNLNYGALTLFGHTSQSVLLLDRFVTIVITGSSAFARRYLQNRFYFLFLQVLRYFSSLRLASLRMTCLLHAGFPHSDIHGSLRTYCSPWRFAVSCVLLRLLVPRHPLCALSSLTFYILLILTDFI